MEAQCCDGSGRRVRPVEIWCIREPAASAGHEADVRHDRTSARWKQVAPLHSAQTAGDPSGAMECLPASRNRSPIVSWSMLWPVTVTRTDWHFCQVSVCVLATRIYIIWRSRSDGSIHHHEGWQNGNVEFCQITLLCLRFISVCHWAPWAV